MSLTQEPLPGGEGVGAGEPQGHCLPHQAHHPGPGELQRHCLPHQAHHPGPGEPQRHCLPQQAHHPGPGEPQGHCLPHQAHHPGPGEPQGHCLPQQAHHPGPAECEMNSLNSCEYVTVSEHCNSRNDATVTPLLSVTAEDEVVPLKPELPQEVLRPSEGWETCSNSSGYSEGSLRGEELPEDCDTDAFINCGHDDFPFCQCLSDKVGGTSSFHCEHDDFPFCDCLSQAAARKHKGSLRYGSPRGERRRRRRGYIGPSLIAFRDAGLEVFDETEESDFQESETDTDYAAGLESDVEGAVGYTGHVVEDPPSAGLLAPPGTPGVRRASIVTCDSRTGSIHTPPEPIKLAVFGADGVGKSALIVRLLTGRFIGEYDPTMEAVYSYQFPLPGHDLPLQVMDTAGQVEVVEQGRERQVAWGDGFLLVFSLVSHPSFVALSHLRRVILELTPGAPRPMVLVGNKADLSHAREVSDHEIRDLADCWGCDYFEVAAPEPWDVVVRPFTALYQAVLESRDSH